MAQTLRASFLASSAVTHSEQRGDIQFFWPFALMQSVMTEGDEDEGVTEGEGGGSCGGEVRHGPFEFYICTCIRIGDMEDSVLGPLMDLNSALAEREDTARQKKKVRERVRENSRERNCQGTKIQCWQGREGKGEKVGSSRTLNAFWLCC